MATQTPARPVAESRFATSRLYVDGRIRPSEIGAVYANISPVTGEILGHAADGTSADMDDAIAAARRAFDETDWSRDHKARLDHMVKFRDALKASRDRLRDHIKAETGCPESNVAVPQVDSPLAFLDYPVETLRTYDFDRKLGGAHVIGLPSRREVWKEAAGVVGAITPWNVPLQINLAKVIPALCAGCTVVLKPAPETPWAATIMGEIAHQIGLPPGVFNVVTSSAPVAIGDQLVRDPRVDLISFTGSSGTGRKIMAAAADQVKKVFLELGGKSAHIVLDDADLESLMAFVPFSSVYHAGQGCALFTRLLVPRSRYDEAVALLKTTFEGIAYDDPDDATQMMGPLISERQRQRVLDYIRIGQAEGAKLLVGGGVPGDLPGYYVEPTLFVDVDNGMRIAQEEIFGPVLVVIPYEDDEDAIRIANDSIFGLSGAVSSGSLERATRVARRIRTGTLTINGGSFFAADTPFGGYKQSGLGREMGLEGFEEYLETKAVGLPL
jgi:aldehyde dehydrogenase (NAD+)